MSGPNRTAARIVSGLQQRLYTASQGRLARRTIPKSSGFPLARLKGDGVVIMLTTRGRKTGTMRTTPVVAVPLDEGWAVAASFGGSDKHPVWYLNLDAAGSATVTDRGRLTQVEPIVLDGPERAATWERLTAAFPGFGGYEQLTDRAIPVIALRPTAADADQPDSPNLDG